MLASASNIQASKTYRRNNWKRHTLNATLRSAIYCLRIRDRRSCSMCCTCAWKTACAIPSSTPFGRVASTELWALAPSSPIRDFPKPADATGTTLATIDTFGPTYSLPAKRSTDIVIAKPIAGRVCIPQSRRYVYTKFTLDVLKEFRKPGDKSKDLNERRHITAAQFDESIRFPSGYLETFLPDRRGFVEIGKQYLLFMWKPIPSDDTLVIGQTYRIENGVVFPVSTDGDAQTVYTNMPFPEFEIKVKEIVERNVDADGTEPSLSK